MCSIKQFALLALLPMASAFAASPQSAVLEVKNMTCDLCPLTVKKALEKVPGVSSAKVDFKTKRAVVAFDSDKTSPQALTKATTNAGYPSVVADVH